jgi:hypothetical protein
MIIPVQFGFNFPSGFREEAFWNIFPIGSNVKREIQASPLMWYILNITCQNLYHMLYRLLRIWSYDVITKPH